MFDFHLEDAAGNRYWGRTGYASYDYAVFSLTATMDSTIPSKHVDRGVIYYHGEPYAVLMRHDMQGLPVLVDDIYRENSRMFKEFIGRGPTDRV